MNYNTLRNKPTINYKEIIGDNTVTDVGGITEEEFDDLLNTDLASYYTKAEIDELFSRSFIEKEKSGSIVTFDCPTSITTGISEVTSEIVAVQSGTGDPSPTNVRPISGWSAVNVVVSPTTDVEDGTTYTTTLKDGQGNPMTCYGGELSNVNGVQTLDNIHAYAELSENWNWQKSSTYQGSFYVDASATLGYKTYTPIMCSHAKTINNIADYVYGGCLCEGSLNFWLMSAEASVQDWKDYIVAQRTNGTPIGIKFELSAPQQIPQDSLSIATQEGTNNLWADSGDITVKALDRIIQG